MKNAGWIWGATALALAGCGGPPALQAPDGIDGVEALPVERPRSSSSLGKQQWKVGEYEIQDVDREGTKKKSSGVGGYSSGKTKGGFKFTVIAPKGGKVAFECETQSKEKGSALGGGMSLGWSWQSMSCQAGDSGKLTIEPPEKDGDPVGTLDSGLGELKITPLHELSNGKTQRKPAGFLFEHAESGPVAAMDVNGLGVLHLSGDGAKEDPPVVVGAGIAMLLFTEFVSQQNQ